MILEFTAKLIKIVEKPQLWVKKTCDFLKKKKKKLLVRETFLTFAISKLEEQEHEMQI